MSAPLEAASPSCSQKQEEELPQNDGTCDACEPDEPQPAALLCHRCGFSFCAAHADEHRRSTNHLLEPIVPKDAEPQVEGAELAAQAGQEVAAAAGGSQEEKRQRDSVTVERLRCKEHGQEGSLYCRTDEKIICVVCAVQGEHREHEIITLREAYLWQKNKPGVDLVNCTHEMAEKIKAKWTSPDMTTHQLEEYVNQHFDELHRLVKQEERRTLHLVDLKEAFLISQAAEKIAEINVHTEKLQEEMALITQQLGELEKAEEEGRVEVEARPRPELRRDPPRDHGQDGSSSSIGHAP